MAKVEKIVGIDISKSTFSVAYRSGLSVKTNEWNYTDGQIRKFAETLQGEACIAIMEATGVYHTRLAYHLHSKGIKVSVVNPLAAKNYARMQMRRTKTDKADSVLLMEYGEMMDLEPWRPREEWCVEVQQIQSLIEGKNKELTASKNRMEALSHSEHASKMCVEMLKKDIERVKKDIKKLEKEMERLVISNDGDNMRRLETIPGMGRKTSCMLLAMTESMKHFDSCRQLSSYLGLCPRVYESGASVRGKARICKMGLGSARNALYLCSWSAIKFNKKCREMYERLIEKGKAKKLALIAVANKLLKQAFAVLKSGVDYDENYISEKKVQKTLAY